MDAPLPREEGTLMETLERWADRGYRANLAIRNGKIIDLTSHRSYDPGTVHVDAVARFEGVSNPDDNSIALALSDDAQGLRGVLVAAFGPTFVDEDADVLASLHR